MLILNAVLFQACWFALVLGAAHQLPWLGTIVAMAFIVIHYTLNTSHRRNDTILAIVCMVFGFMLDTLWVQSGLLIYPPHLLPEFAAPLWIVGLWLCFALTLNHSLSWLKGRALLSSAIGGLGSAFSYNFAAKLGAVEIATDKMFALSVLGLSWAVVIPLLMWLAEKLESLPPQGQLLTKQVENL